MKNGVLVAGLGPGAVEAVPARLVEELTQADRVYLRTAKHPVIPWLKEQGVFFESLDHVYEEHTDFETVYLKIVSRVIAAAQRELVAYVVPGHPFVAEKTTTMIAEQARAAGLDLKIVPAMSFLDALFAALHLDPTSGVLILDALETDRFCRVPYGGAVVSQVYNRLVAGEVKIRLMAYYPDNFTVWVVQAAGVPQQERIEKIPLYALDRLEWFDHLTSVYVPPLPGSGEAVDACLSPLARIMATLRGPDGCPWDRKQTHQSLGRYLVEETYEVLEAIDKQNMYSLREELGDLLLQIVFHAQLAKEKGYFNLDDVIQGICDKMIRRHPHVFGQKEVADAEEVVANWEQLKRKEKARSRETSLINVPRSLPALLRAERVQDKAARVGFDWPDFRGALDKLEEELSELREVLPGKDHNRLREELGDLLFAVVNVARLLGLDAEEALRNAVDKFERRFAVVERECELLEKEPGKVSLAEMNRWWETAKKLEKS